jgi:hypothetical protein
MKKRVSSGMQTYVYSYSKKNAHTSRRLGTHTHKEYDLRTVEMDDVSYYVRLSTPFKATRTRTGRTLHMQQILDKK